jgi:hypothetical protein
MLQETHKALPGPSVTSPNVPAIPDAEQPSLDDVVTQFVTNVDSLADTLPLTQLALLLGQAATSQQVNTIKDVDSENYLQVMKSLKHYKKAEAASTLITRSFLVSLVSQFDALVGGILRTLFVWKPEAINIADKQISYADLITFGSIEMARDHIIENEVETVLRKSHSEQFDWLENRFKLPLREELTIWPRFIELTERRNLFVHASGRVSQQYLNVCKSQNVMHSKPVSRNDELDIDLEYFQQAYECILELGVKLAHTLWRKQRPDDRIQADSNLNSIGYELISEKKYKLAQRLLEFGIGQKKHSSEEQRRIFVINCAQASKWAGDEKSARTLITAWDWTASSDNFRLAAKVLLDEFDAAATIMKTIGPNGKPVKSEYREWPVFSEFRKSKQFLTTYEHVFGEPFSETPATATAELTKALAGLKNALAAKAAAAPPETSNLHESPERPSSDGG